MNHSSLNTIREQIKSLSKRSSFKLASNLEKNYENYLLSRDGLNDSSSIFPSSWPTFISASQDCSQCFYGLQLDTYMFGCTHDCLYCWAKTEQTKKDLWNNPSPIPFDLTTIWNLFCSHFDEQSETNFKSIFNKKIPIRIGSMSDPFIRPELTYQVTFELIRLLEHYQYPYLILTRSDMVSKEPYLNLISPSLGSVQFSIPGLNEDFVKILEPGTPSPLKRLNAVKLLREKKIWVGVRINPLFPNRPDGFYSQNKTNTDLLLNFFDLELLKKIKESDCKSVIAGFVHLELSTAQDISNKIKINLLDFVDKKLPGTDLYFKYSYPEIRYYYEIIAKFCKENDIKFSTCYLGLSDSYFWRDQDLWDDKKDCCSIKGNVIEFKQLSDSVSIHHRITTNSQGKRSIVNIIDGFMITFKNFILKNLWK